MVCPALSDCFLKNHDAVICSSYNYNSCQQEYQLVTDYDARDAARGSKYFQAVVGDIFRIAEEWLKLHPGKKLLFVGTGCHTAGFQSYAEQKGFIDRIVTVDIICHGVPSPKIWKDYVNIIKKNHGKISFLTFKDKRNGWNAPVALAKIGEKEVFLREYVRMYYSRNMLRLSCHKCPYAAIERKTDITIGDFWHIEDALPLYYDKMGTSLILIHSQKGMELFDEAKFALDFFESNAEKCWQSNLEKPTAVSNVRDAFWRDYRNHGVEFILKKYGHDSLIRRIKLKLRNMFRH